MAPLPNDVPDRDDPEGTVLLAEQRRHARRVGIALVLIVTAIVALVFAWRIYETYLAP
jgi:hypothetical protein